MALGAVSTLAGGALMAGMHPAVADPWLPRIGVVALMVGVFAASFVRRLDAWANEALVVVLWVVTAHQFWLVWVSNLAAPHVVACLGLIGAVSGMAPFLFRGLRSLLPYLAAVIGLAAVVSTTARGEAFFFLPVASLCAVVIVLAQARWSYEGELRRTAEAERALQGRLQHADKLSALGSLVAGVAHEVTNPLTFVLLNLELVEGELSEGVVADLPEARRALAAVRDGIERVRDIVSELRAHSRHGTDERAPVQLSEVVHSAVAMLGIALTHNVTLVRDVRPTPPVLGSASRLTQVVVNLLQNAQQAVAETSGASGRPGQVWVRVYEADGMGVVEVNDDGPGLAPKVAGRLFEPFFTTKPVHVGTGLGLFVSHRIVTDHEGTIELVASGPGATFRVRIPLAAVPAPQAPVTTPRAPAPHVGGHLLIVEDDRAVAAALKRLFSKHTVTLCHDGSEALGHMRLQRYDVVLCDVMMPGMGGRELWYALREERPGEERSIVFLTGGAFTADAQRFLDEVPNRTFLKPIDGPALRAYVTDRLRPSESD